MNIGIDGNEANIKNRVGVNVYAFKLLYELKKLNEKRVNPHNLIVYLKNEPLSDLPKETNNFRYKIISGGGLWIITKLTPYLFKNPEKIQILFSPSHYTSPLLTIPKIVSIMDLGYLENSGHFTKKVFWQLKYWTAISIFASKQVLTISEASKKDIVRHYPFASKKIKVTYLSHDLDEKDFKLSENDVRRVKNKYSIVGDYILYLGTLKPSKNVDGLIKAFNIISKKKEFKNIKLVIAGKKGWLFESLFELVEKLKLNNRVIFTDFFPEEDKTPLRIGAKVFVQVSHTEGFGIDTLSCMAIGTPVVVSNVGSLPEVAGGAGVVVDEKDEQNIACGIEKVLKLDKNEYNKLVAKGKVQASKFSWERCAKETLEVIENVI
jgi:glycosyltransferase involved in cell wall biosynthesis